MKVISKYLDLGIGYPWVGQRAAESDPTLISLISITLLRIFVRIAPVGSKITILKCRITDVS